MKLFLYIYMNDGWFENKFNKRKVVMINDDNNWSST